MKPELYWLALTATMTGLFAALHLAGALALIRRD